MNFDFPGYELKFIQKKPCRDESAHQFSLIYKFSSPVTGYHYILTAEYHLCDVFGIKFYCKKDRHSDFKYSRIINKGDLGNILITCAKVVPLLLNDYPEASFGFLGSRSVDSKSKTIENYDTNQRFKTYSYIIQKKFGVLTFEHIEFPKISAYLLVNRECKDVKKREAEIINMITENYEYLPDIIP